MLVNGTVERRFDGDPGQAPAHQVSPLAVLERLQATWTWADLGMTRKVWLADDPEGWLRGLAYRYHGAYFWVDVENEAP